MKLIHLTDIHSNAPDLGKLFDLHFDLMILSGDITHFGGMKDLSLVYNKLAHLTPNILAVTGNCDYKECSDFLRKKGISLEENIVLHKGFQIIGLGGSLRCPGKTPNEYSEFEYNSMLKKLKERLNPELPTILVTHQPPYNTLNDKIFLNRHVGSKIIREFIEETQPIACLTGHIHEGKGIDYIGKCPIINPGAAINGHYAILNFTGETLENIDIN